MIINCGKEELERMSINCHNGQCSACVLDGICGISDGISDRNFIAFIGDVHCYNPAPPTLQTRNGHV